MSELELKRDELLKLVDSIESKEILIKLLIIARAVLEEEQKLTTL